MRDNEKELLARYFPNNAIEMVTNECNSRRFLLILKSPRTTKLGDFRPASRKDDKARITLNRDMNPYQMLITFIHELAHYDVHINYNKKVLPHGIEWKTTYTRLMQPYMNCDIFPPDILQQLKQHLINPSASSLGNHELYKTIKEYDNSGATHNITLEELPENTLFRLKNGLVLRKGTRLRKYFKCYTANGKQTFRVSALAECEIV